MFEICILENGGVQMHKRKYTVWFSVLLYLKKVTISVALVAEDVDIHQTKCKDIYRSIEYELSVHQTVSIQRSVALRRHIRLGTSQLFCLNYWNKACTCAVDFHNVNAADAEIRYFYNNVFSTLPSDNQNILRFDVAMNDRRPVVV